MMSESKRLNILVLGDLILDEYKWGSCDRISPEAPVPVVNIKKETQMLGGAGNVIKNLVALNVDVSIIGVVGDDKPGKIIKQLLDDLSVNALLVVEEGRMTSQKTRIFASNQQVVRYDKETICSITDDSQRKLKDILYQYLPSTDIILLSDYNKGVLTQGLVKDIISIGRLNNIKTIIDPKGSDFSKYKNAYLIKPNKKEAGIAAGIPIHDEESLKRIGKKLREDIEVNYLVITLSEDGMAIFGETYLKMPTKSQDIYDVTGAGDTVLACLGYCLAKGDSVEEACHFANHAAAIVVGKVGSAIATLDEINERINNSLKQEEKVV